MRSYYSQLGFIAGLLLSVSASAEEPADRYKAVVDRMVDAINKEDYPGIQADFAKIMLDAFPLEKSKPFFRDLVGNAGKIKKLGVPRLVPPNQATFPAYFERAVLDIKVVLDGQNRIIGLWFLPHTPEISVPEKHATVFELPFEGQWMVFWGGDTMELNQHHDVPNQKYGIDLLRDKNGTSHRGEGRKNEDYFAFGQNVLAPADGVVTDVIRGIRDNTPGSMNPYSALGNAVIIRHREDEVSVLAHFKQNSIRVDVGDNVKKGQVLGLCGNSGNSSEPHIHYHLQNTSTIQDGTGIKCIFSNVTVSKDGTKRTETEYSPVKNDMVGNE